MMNAGRRRLHISIIIGLAATLLCFSAAGAESDTSSGPVTEVANIRFHSAELLNLHHTLYAAAWARRPGAGTGRALAGNLPAALDAPLTSAERAVWDNAVEHYDKNVASRDLLFGRGMVALKAALVAGDLASPDVGSALREVLESAAPIYRSHFWPAHDRANRAWIAATTERMRMIAPETTAKLEKFYGVKWFAAPVRADLVWVANRQGAYTTVAAAHATISSGDPSSVEWAAVEIVFHEFSHALVLPMQDALARALGDRLRDHAVLWHVVQFYVTGTAVQQVLRARGITYEPYLYSTGLFDRAWPQYRQAVETSWEPYVQGTISQDDAIRATVKAVVGQR